MTKDKDQVVEERELPLEEKIRNAEKDMEEFYRPVNGHDLRIILNEIKEIRNLVKELMDKV
jgi:hypothetical protein